MLHAERETREHRPHHEIDHHRAEHKEDRRRDEIRQERLPLVAIKAGRDEHVDLAGDHREGDEGRAEQRELELHDEIFEQPGIDEFRIFRAGHPDIGPGQHVVDLLGEEETDDRGERERGDRLDEPARSSIR